MHKSAIEHMVSRFLSWRLPDNFSPDGGVSFEPNFMRYGGITARHEPTGTNLFDGQQATAMVRHMVEGLPSDTAAPAVDMGEIERLIAHFRNTVETWTTDIGPDNACTTVRRELETAIRTAIVAAEARALERAATYAATYQRDASFDDSMVGAKEHNANQSNIAAGIRALNKAGTP